MLFPKTFVSVPQCVYLPYNFSHPSPISPNYFSFPRAFELGFQLPRFVTKIAEQFVCCLASFFFSLLFFLKRIVYMFARRHFCLTFSCLVNRFHSLFSAFTKIGLYNFLSFVIFDLNVIASTEASTWKSIYSCL